MCVRDTEAMTPRPRRKEAELLPVGATSALVGLSVRTLHHWDEVGLVRPSGRTAAGYRLYSGEDIARLHRALVYRELGFPLAEVMQLLDDPTVDERAHLARQRELLAERIDHLQQMVCAVDRLMEADTMNEKLTPQQQAEIFGRDWNPEYQREAEERWGDTQQWEQSRQRAAQLSRQDWQQIKARGDDLEQRLARAKRDGVEAGSDAADALAEEHRAMIGQFYDCTYSMHVCLGNLYVQDSRFTAHYDALEPGLAEWLRCVIAANARAHGTGPDTAVWE